MRPFVPFLCLALALTFWPTVLGAPAVTYGVVSRNVQQTDLNLTVALLTNTAATASTLAGYDASKKMVTRQAVNADVAAAAAIDATKIANGTVSNTEFQLLDGVTTIGNLTIPTGVAGQALYNNGTAIVLTNQFFNVGFPWSTNTPTRIVGDGDSHMFGTGATTVTNNSLSRFANMMLNTQWRYSTNNGIGGRTMGSGLSEYYAEIEPLKPASGTNVVIFTYFGLNDLAQGTNVTVLIAAYDIYATLLRSNGFYHVASTLSPIAFTQTAAIDQGRLTFNAHLRNKLIRGEIDLLLDEANLMPPPMNTYWSDSAHKNDAGYALIATNWFQILQMGRYVQYPLVPNQSSRNFDFAQPYRGLTAISAVMRDGLIIESTNAGAGTTLVLGGTTLFHHLKTASGAFATTDLKSTVNSADTEFYQSVGRTNVSPVWSIKFGGRLTANTTQVGNALTGEDDLMTYSVPAGILAVNGQNIFAIASGSFAANANLKTLKCYWGATQVFSSGAIAANAGDWRMEVQVIRTGAATQIVNVDWSSGNALLISSAAVVTATETLGGAVVLKWTAEATLNDDATQRTATVNYNP